MFFFPQYSLPKNDEPEFWSSQGIYGRRGKRETTIIQGCWLCINIRPPTLCNNECSPKNKNATMLGDIAIKGVGGFFGGWDYWCEGECGAWIPSIFVWGLPE